MENEANTQQHDLELMPHPDGTLIHATTFKGQDFIVQRYRMMADPIVDPIGVILVKRMADDDGLQICDLTAEA
jgi:hypothetical protein